MTGSSVEEPLSLGIKSKITVIADCCAGLTKESHEAALKVMECCQCNIR